MYTSLLLFIIAIIRVASAALIRYGTPLANESPLVSAELHLMGEEIEQAREFTLPECRPERTLGEEIEFELFDKEVVVGTVSRIFDRGADGGTTWSGNVVCPNSADGADTSFDLFTLTCFRSACVARINIESKRSVFEMDPSPYRESFARGMHRMSKVKRKLKPGTEPENIVSSAIHDDPFEKPDQDQILDMGVLYTPESVQRIGGSHNAMVAKVHNANTDANLVLERSGVSLRYRIVFILPLLSPNYTEPGTDRTSMSNMLTWLRVKDDGIFDEAQIYRDKYKADLIGMVVRADASAGRANLPSPGFRPDWVYSLYFVDYVSSSTWTHEIGHNLNCWHDRYEDGLSPNSSFYGYGDCWEDASKNDCTCYKSIMVYDCNTTRNSCTSCPERPYYSNKNIIDAGSPTGSDLASCGLHIHNTRYTATNYRASNQPGGVLESVLPSTVPKDGCYLVNITGWAFSFGPSDFVTRVTLDGVEATIISSDENHVVVQSPKVATKSHEPGDVVVFSDSGRVTTLHGGFEFTDMEAEIVSDFSRGLENTLWESTAEADWGYEVFNGIETVKKEAGAADGMLGTLELTKLKTSSLQNSCYETLKSLSFQYYAYSGYAFCYTSFTVSSMNAAGVWALEWTGETGLNSGETPWLNGYINLPQDTRSVRVDVQASGNTNCRWHAPVYLTNVTTLISTQCTSSACPVAQTVNIPYGLDTSVFIRDEETAFNGVSTAYHEEKVSQYLHEKLTLSVFINTAVANTYIMSLGKNSASHSYNSFALFIDTFGYVNFVDYGDLVSQVGFQAVCSTIITTAEETHIVFVKDGLMGTFYVNGVRSGSYEAAHSVAYNNEYLDIGIEPISGGKYFLGEIKALRIYRAALNEVEVSTLYHMSKTSGAPTQMPIYISTDAPSSEPAYVPPTRAPMVAIDAPIFQMMPSKRFDGMNDKYIHPVISNRLSSTMTISCWIRTRSRNKNLISLGRSATNPSDRTFTLSIHKSGKLTFWDFRRGYGFPRNQFLSDEVVNNNEWVHIAFVKSRRMGKFFINGKYSGKFQANKDVTYRRTTLAIGHDAAHNKKLFRGYIGRVQIFDVAMTAPEVDALYIV
mmetsp:Transcript_22763/g.22972  ORF Transcript_22763/g.22972 Transcript_22763/m.22972 type:complete len:1090 (-) Transcript_22763:249-3518(-)